MLAQVSDVSDSQEQQKLFSDKEGCYIEEVADGLYIVSESRTRKTHNKLRKSYQEKILVYIKNTAFGELR